MLTRLKLVQQATCPQQVLLRVALSLTRITPTSMPACFMMGFLSNSSVLIGASKYPLCLRPLQIAIAHNESSKKFRTAHSLIAHLKSPAHNRERMLCTTCLHKFNSKAALVQHMESSITRCGVRKSDGFRPTLAKLTGGILDTEPMSHLEDQGDPENMVRDMSKIIVYPKAIAELQITPPEHVPGSEPKDDRKPAAGQEAIDWSQGRPNLTDTTAW